MKHREDCFQKEKSPCLETKSLYGEPIDQHFWSGWPGAFCLKCGSEDKDELCIGNSCKCECHDEFWRSYEEHCRKNEME